MKKLLQISVLVLCMGGCVSPVQKGWNNFNAYFNTFYNTNQFFEEGVEKNQRQIPEINPEFPIRAHLEPTRAGLDDFEKAINGGASILRKHNDSRYVEPAIFVIGRSYYYRSEFFAALQKFRELQTISSGDLLQKSILWQGRTFLEMSNIAEGIRFLESEIELTDNWEPSILAETRLVLAQLYTKQEDWENANLYLDGHIQVVSDSGTRARAYFLHGQILEKLNRFDEALEAYSRVEQLHPNYDLIFNANRKEAEITRMIGDFEKALELYTKMERDDKNMNERLELTYEVARTNQIMGNTERANELYNRLLHNRFQNANAATKAKAYYGMGEIYRDEFHDFEYAAAYFDSAASQRTSQGQLPANFNAAELARDFAEYTKIKNEIDHRDSLLHLASLTPEELDSVVAEIQLRRQKEMQDELKRLRDQQDQIVVVDSDEINVVDATESLENGFLNIQNQRLLADASLQFQAIWGDRPLADNWRRREAVSGTRTEQITEMASQAGDGQQTIMDSQMALDMSDIPFEEDQKIEMKKELSQFRYDLANVFFVALNMPDSAKVNYKRVAEEPYNDDLKIRSIYSLAELELLQNNRNEAEKWADELFKLAPSSIFYKRISERFGMDISDIEEESEMSAEVQYNRLSENQKNLPAAEKAENLKLFAQKSATEQQKPLLLFEAAKEFMKAATNELESEASISEWFQKQQEWTIQQNELAALKDSAEVMLADTSIARDEYEYWLAVNDSTLNEPDFLSLFPFEGAYWDSTRSLLTHIEDEYRTSNIVREARLLNQTLEKPVQTQAEVEEETENAEDVRNPQQNGELVSCSDLQEPPQIKGGMELFLDSIAYPDWTDGMSMQGEVHFLINIEPDGSLMSYEQVGVMDRTGIPQAFESAMDSFLEFEPLSAEQPIECMISFPFEF